ncbi:hypothetical protein A1OS_22660 [Enterovibrio norvegicus]|uniref:Opioid growth factor receptor (OGFr) conserved region n=2 Tax=Enterovibrio norvegicus TaxID=188144 RepID=A0A1I5VHA9_9GAMM|nr:opioid growth factor receptor-related protein [Enterovibrio norvegicus]OEE51639.1 hypothetical protein A1OS_22660 [Enterovibrio norvegicus]OEF58000.1 hypothetical protein A1OU_07270 [Enterovibrio norvegicus]SFQ06938.1 Opioid growth factor receptor (OGFr) conserved region [Enterovibrio norvegicus DSM 15893]
MSDIARFLSGEIPDAFGRHISALLAYNHFWLEHDHKYIQVFFPIDEGTKFNKHAPLVTPEDSALFESSESLQRAHLQALDLMLEFWGMKRTGETITSELPFSPKHHIWLKPHDHNQLRLTRAIRSLHLLGNQRIAANLCQFVVDAATELGTVSDKTLDFWRNALRG